MEALITALLVAGLTALIIGALMLGNLIGKMKANTISIQALHARFDVLLMALAQHGIIDAGTVAHVSREAPR